MRLRDCHLGAVVSYGTSLHDPSAQAEPGEIRLWPGSRLARRLHFQLHLVQRRRAGEAQSLDLPANLNTERWPSGRWRWS